MFNATFKVGLFLCALSFFGSSQAYATGTDDQASASKSPNLSVSSNAFTLVALADSTIDKAQKTETDKNATQKPVAAPLEKKPLQHTVVENESLTMIAEKHASTWTRLFAKNTQITHPDILNVGETITIPFADEQLAERALPVPQPQAVVTALADKSGGAYAPASHARTSSAGNTYYAGYCTWYAKERRPDLPNNLGNADQWVSRAQAQGIATGSAPSAGAIGQQGMHVVYVESVNGDGTVTISEMNYQGLYVTSTRTVPAGSFMYIY